jgi:hypothetical protein
MITLLLVFLGLQSPDIMKVEEDWELVLNVPADELETPQLHSAMSPHANMEGLYAQITWNYREQPDFNAGGMQLQAWYEDSFIIKKNFGSDALSTTSETVSWTQGIETTGTWIKFYIQSGQSQTWGDFGGTDLTLSGSYAVGNLNAYSPDVTVAHSWITFGSNRVNMLRIKEVRYYDAGGNLVNTDTTPKVIHSEL